MSFDVKGLRWRMISLVMLGAILNYLTRATLAVAVAGSTLMADLHMTEREYGWIGAVFQLTIMLQPLCGMVLDTIGLKLGFALFALAWSLINMMHGLAASWPMLAFLRGLLGLAEGSANPAGVKATAEWFPARERGLAGGVYNIGASAGTMLAPPLVAWAILAHSWRAAFVITGALGLAWLVLWWRFYHPPSSHPRLSAQEREYIVSGQEAHLAGDSRRPSFISIARQRNFWGIGIPRLLADPTWITLSAWLPLYLAKERGFQLKELALFAWLPFLAADIGCIFGGVLAMALQKRGVTLVNSRRITFTLGACLMLGLAGVGFVKSPYVAILLLSLGGFAHQTLSVTVITMASDLFKRNEVATAAGMAGTLGNLGVLLFQLLIAGFVLTIGYTPFFIGLAVLDVLGAIVLWTVVKDPASPAGRLTEARA